MNVIKGSDGSESTHLHASEIGGLGGLGPEDDSHGGPNNISCLEGIDFVDFVDLICFEEVDVIDVVGFDGADPVDNDSSGFAAESSQGASSPESAAKVARDSATLAFAEVDSNNSSSSSNSNSNSNVNMNHCIDDIHPCSPPRAPGVPRGGGLLLDARVSVLIAFAMVLLAHCLPCVVASHVWRLCRCPQCHLHLFSRFGLHFHSRCFLPIPLHLHLCRPLNVLFGLVFVLVQKGRDRRWAYSPGSLVPHFQISGFQSSSNESLKSVTLYGMVMM